MKKLFCILLFIFPIDLYAQHPWENSAALEYMWKYVGDEGFSAGKVEYTSLAFSPSGQPYVAYQDWGNAKKVTVMKYDSVYVGINEPSKSEISIYPNPATDKMIIETSGASEGNYLVVVNIKGQELINQRVTVQDTQIDISSLPSGIYFVKVLGVKGVQVKKFIKQ